MLIKQEKAKNWLINYLAF